MGRFRRVITDVAPVCPAGKAVAEVEGGSGCFCSITLDVIDSVTGASDLNAYCMGDYTACPTWRDDKQHTWAERTNRPLLDEDGNLRVPDDLDLERERVLREREQDEEMAERGARIVG